MSISMIFQQPRSRGSLGLLLREARVGSRLTLEESSKASSLSVAEINALENDNPLDPRIARLRAVIHARSLGIDPAAIRDFLPASPDLAPKNLQYLSNTARPLKPRWRPSVLLEVLAPMGKAALYLFLFATILGGWGMVRQLSRVRAVPWITSTAKLSELPVQ
ncbi:MAG: helix-turn-helix domain-containing protein [Chthoniobacterales bacterium]